MPSFSHAMAQPRSRMLSLHLGGMIIQSQIPMNFIPTQPELNMKLVYIKKKEFRMHLAVFRQLSCLFSKNSFKKSNSFGFVNPFLTHFLPATKQTVCKRLMHMSSAML